MSKPADTQSVAVPTDIAEYQKFVAAGGNDANAAKPKTSEAPHEDEGDETDPDSETGDQAQKGKKKSGFQRRVTRLNREIGARDAKIAELETKLAAHGGGKKDETPAKKEDAQAEPAPKPKLDDFPSYDEYVEALTDWKTEQKLAERESRKQQADEQKADTDKGKAVTNAHNARVDEAKTRYTDWDKAFTGLTDDSFTDAMVVGIMESDVGPDITYHLAKNRDELARIAKLSPVRQAAEIGKLEAKFLKEAAEADGDEEDDEPETPPEPKPKTRVTNAPAPAKPIRGRGTGDDPMPDPADFSKYEAWAKRQAAKARNN